MKLNIYNWSYCDAESPSGRFPETADELIWCMRDLRDVLLKESDWILMQDSPIEESLKDEWRVWRQWMRDITIHVTITGGEKYVEIPDPPAKSPASWAHVTFKD